MRTSRRALAVLATGCLLALAGCGSGSEESGSIRVGLPSPNPVERVGAIVAQSTAVSLSTAPHPGLLPASGNCSATNFEACFSFGAFVSGSGISSPLGWEYTLEALYDGNVEPIIDDVPAGSGRTLTLEVWTTVDASSYDPVMRNGVLIFRGQAGGLNILPNATTNAGVVFMSTAECPFNTQSACNIWGVSGGGGGSGGTTYNFDDGLLPTVFSISGPGWFIENTKSNSPSYSAGSGVITGGYAGTCLSLVPSISTSSITFYYNVSSKLSIDVLKFYVDAVVQGEWSGFVGWTKASFTHTSHVATYNWCYEKGEFGSEAGLDKAWVDDITINP